MSTKAMELRQEHKNLLAEADKIVGNAENLKRPLNGLESAHVDALIAQATRLETQIKAFEANNSLLTHVRGGQLIPGNAKSAPETRGTPRFLSAEYAADFMEYIRTNGRAMGAALYEGAAGDGGYAVPITVEDQIVPLAPKEMGVRQIATVIPTTMDIKFPIKASFGTASAKAETSAFTESELTLGQFTLSAYMAGIQENLSWELAQDVPAFQAFTVDDMLLAQQMYEENLYVNGSGSGQAQGLIGNVGAGVTEEPDSNGNLVSISGTLDLIATLNAVYHPNASWLMARTTSVIIRKAQVETNLFNPVWTREGKQDFLHGYPVAYSSLMPTAARGAAPVLFGDFKRGYIIGDRGGSGINVKVLDQPLATQGLIVLLAYRRTDGRVRRSEAIQQYNVAAS